MQPDAIAKVTLQVARSYPQMASVRPTVRRQPAGHGEEYLLSYRASSTLPGGKSLTMIVRVVADPHGRILKMSTSR